MERRKQRQQQKLRFQQQIDNSQRDNCSTPNHSFDVSKHIRLGSPFSGEECISHFNKIANNLKWSIDNLTLLLRSVLIGKGRIVYTQLSIDQSADYEIVKEFSLQSYELVPEAYRQKFRKSEQRYDQTYGVIQDRRAIIRPLVYLYQSRRHNLCQLILLEEFTNCVNTDISTLVG